MDGRTLTALQKSIEKWRQIESGNGFDGRSSNCALCLEFPDDCLGCPVEEAGFEGCSMSPYDEWDDACSKLDRLDSESRIADTPELVRLARAERKFLESLLPKGA